MTPSARILYMEDDQALARLIRARLGKAGYHVDVAPDGQRGLEDYAAGRHDLLLVDQSMPGLDGLGVVRALAAQGELPPTIIVTGTGDEATAVEAMRLGVSDYVIKDLAGGYLQVLPLAIGRALERARLREQKLEAEKALQRRTQQLDERVRELDCLRAVSRLLEDVDTPVSQLLDAVLALIGPAWQHPDVTCARITLDDVPQQTGNFRETPWMLRAPIVVDGRLTGALDVGYLEPRPDVDEGPFTKEEHLLLGNIADHLGRVLQRRRAQAEIRNLKQQIEFVLGATKTGLRVVDADRRVRYVDPAWQTVYGDPSGKTYAEYFGEEDAADLESRFAEAMATRRPVVTTATLPREDNRPVQRTAIPFRDDEGWMLAEVVVDISERRRMEEELAQSQKLEAIGQLAAGIAHEINTPIQYIGDNTRFLQEAFSDLMNVLAGAGELVAAARAGHKLDRALDDVDARRKEADVEYLAEEIPRAIEQSLEGVNRVAHIVRAMKEFSHPGGNQKQAVDLNKAIENTLTISRNEWKYVAELVTDFDPDLPLVPALLGSLNQAFLNLVMNAAQAIAATVGEDGSPKGILSVTTRRDGDWAEIRVRDTGCGIPRDIRERVFNPFFTTKAVGKGTGQGLAIARSVVVEEHGGSIAFESEVGRGTTFLVRLPLAPRASNPSKNQPLLSATTPVAPSSENTP
ncbi:MAG: response regulator [Pirellulales bacterium]|nr:response regulator [Pirellulales bacterium]